MKDKFNKIFDNITAEPNIKENTISFLKKEIEARNKTFKMFTYKKLVVSMASFLLIFFGSGFFYNLYFLPVTFVDIDVNPSIELTLNKFDKVIGVHSYNEDAIYLTSSINLKYKNYDKAIKILLDYIDEKGYIKNDGLVSVTLQSSNTKREDVILDNIKQTVNTKIQNHHANTSVEVYKVNSDIASHAHHLNTTPAKYIAILELQKLDTKATVDELKNHSITEIRELVTKHSSHTKDSEELGLETHH